MCGHINAHLFITCMSLFLISEIMDPPMDAEDPRSISKANKKSFSQPRDVAGTCLPSRSTRTALGVATVSPLRAHLPPSRRAPRASPWRGGGNERRQYCLRINRTPMEVLGMPGNGAISSGRLLVNI